MKKPLSPLLLSLSFFALVSISNAAPPRFEAEDAVLTNVTKATEAPGHSGSGYVTGLTTDQSKITFHVPAPTAGAYTLTLLYRSPGGEKGYDLRVNNRPMSGMLAKSATFEKADLGRTLLKEGDNVIVLEKGWGWYDVDALEVTPAPPPAALKSVPLTLTDTHADAATTALMKRLHAAYGKETLSGQYNESDNDHVLTVVGVKPAIYGDDLSDFSPSRREHGANPQGWTEKIIARHRGGQIITLCWHWNAPKDLIDKKVKDANGKEVDHSWYFGFYTHATTFDVQKALANPDSEDYRLLIRDMDVIAAELKKLQAAGIPVLWRPLHEAEGGWFWWGAKGPGPCKKLWRLMYDRFTNYHQLHNLIWVWSSGTKADWYPGDDVVDIVGVDGYPKDHTDPLVSTWDALLKQHDGHKILALTEFGKAPDLAGSRALGVRWTYFVSWNGSLGAKGLPDDELKRLYKNAVNVK